MCSLHTRVAKKCSATFEALRAEATHDVPDDTYIRIKAAKQRAVDELMMLQGCASSERFLKALRGPTPSKKSITLVQQHLDDLIKNIR